MGPVANFAMHRSEMVSLQLRMEKESVIDEDHLAHQYDTYLERAGGFGKFQVFVFFTIFCIVIGQTFLVNNIAFLKKQPDIERLNSTSGQWEAYSMKQYCALEDGSNVVMRINWDSIHTIQNWMTKHSMYCADEEQLGFVGSSYFIGMVFGFLFLV